MSGAVALAEACQKISGKTGWASLVCWQISPTSSPPKHLDFSTLGALSGKLKLRPASLGFS